MFACNSEGLGNTRRVGIVSNKVWKRDTPTASLKHTPSNSTGVSVTFHRDLSNYLRTNVIYFKKLLLLKGIFNSRIFKNQKIILTLDIHVR